MSIDFTHLWYLLLVLRGFPARISSYLPLQLGRSRPLLLDNWHRLRSRRHGFPYIPDLLSHPRHQEERSACSRTPPRSSIDWRLHTTGRIFYVRMDSSTRCTLDRQLDWGVHPRHIKLSDISVCLRLPTAVLSEVRSIALCRK